MKRFLLDVLIAAVLAIVILVLIANLPPSWMPDRIISGE